MCYIVRMCLFKSAAIFFSTLIFVLCNHHIHDSKSKFHYKHKSRVDYKASEPFLEVKVEHGLVLGRKINSIYGFNGIPYAKPPIGKLRFEPPQTPNRWQGTWNATFDRNQCIQTELLEQLSLPSLSGSEDCLYINVYIPQKPDKRTLLPVMVWIYGGGFITGNSSYDLYGPDGLVDQNIIVVSFNYRLGIFGFLSTGDDVAPGNIGLKDQIFALKWVKKNIKRFGGDPKKVTIFGESAGGASVSLLVISPLAKGLFQKAIMQSGTAICPWAFSRTAREAAFKVGARLNIRTQNSRSLVDQLKNVSADSLQSQSLSVLAELLFRDPLNGLIFAPVLEHASEDAVIHDEAYESLDKGNFNQVPQIIGYTSLEAALLANISPLVALFTILLNFTPSRLVPLDMNADETQLDTIGRRIRNFYAGSNGSILFPSDNLINYLSDHFFVRPVQKTVNLTSKYVTTYLYRFSYTTNLAAKGAAHADELPYLFNSDRNSTDDRLIKKCMIKLWTNFAKYSDPTPDNENTCGKVTWKPLKPNDRSQMYYLNINRTTTSGQNPSREAIVFWDNLYRQYGNRPFNTY
uniref:Carboxylic ester hydrolase n=1 Tax=Holotrichia parallela TaxID=93412 RepID=A0A6G7SJT6_HOLPA|nr:carboxylesterase 18 [Holotrichia parallela]